MRRHTVLILLPALLLVAPLAAGEDVDLKMLSKIRMEGLGNNSQVMNTLSFITDVSGPRLTGSPGLLRASEWSRDQLAEWGLVNAALEPWGEFGRGWVMEKVSIDLVEPYYFPLIGYPKAWTLGTEGVVRARPVKVQIATEEDFGQYRGKLKGAIVLTADAREVDIGFDPDAERHDEASLRALSEAPLSGGRRRGGRGNPAFRAAREFRNKVTAFFKEEGVAVLVEPGRGKHGTVFVSRGGSSDSDGEIGVPQIVLAVEHYGRLLRMLERDVEVELAIDVKTRVLEEDLQGYNVVAELPGTDPALRDEVVMLGAHIDSWHAGTGATDNAAGTAVTMEALRILQAVGARPRRTIRIGLWSGEEQGLRGSRAYVRNHFGEPGAFTPEHGKFAAYFNMDNGTGRLRGVYLQSNAAVRPIFEAWLEPLHDLGADTLTIRNTGGTDHLAFDGAGLPGFQFIQDEVAYGTRTHHSNMDVYDHVVADDLRQASVIMASFVYNAAMRDEKLPRKPEPQQPQERRGPPTGGPR